MIDSENNNSPKKRFFSEIFSNLGEIKKPKKENTSYELNIMNEDNEIKRISEHYENWSKYGKIDHLPIQGIEIHGWNLIHSTLINIHGENKHTHVFNLIERFLREELNLEESLVTELLVLQRNFLIDYNKISSYPKTITFTHDIFSFVQGKSNLNAKSNYEFDFAENKNMSLQQFCEQIFFARRRNFGKSWITKV